MGKITAHGFAHLPSAAFAVNVCAGFLGHFPISIENITNSSDPDIEISLLFKITVPVIIAVFLVCLVPLINLSGMNKSQSLCKLFTSYSKSYQSDIDDLPFRNRCRHG